MTIRRKLALNYLQQFIGRWYKWGGDDPSGFDCSGIAIEMLKSVGLFPRGADATAATLVHRYKPSTPKPGALIFRGSPVVHVEVIFAVIGDDILTIGASGGGRDTKTEADAIKRNAFIKMRPWAGDYSHCVDPFADEEE
jgi:hypothetical protein